MPVREVRGYKIIHSQIGPQIDKYINKKKNRKIKTDQCKGGKEEERRMGWKERPRSRNNL